MMSIAWEFARARRWSTEHWKVHRTAPTGTVGEMVPERLKKAAADQKPPALVA